MKTVTLQHLPYKTLVERRQTDAHLKFIKAYLGNDYRVKLRARGARKKHALKDGLGPRGYDRELPIKYAETVTAYIAPTQKARNKDWMTCYNWKQNQLAMKERRFMERKHAIIDQLSSLSR